MVLRVVEMTHKVNIRRDRETVPSNEGGLMAAKKKKATKKKATKKKAKKKTTKKKH